MIRVDPVTSVRTVGTARISEQDQRQVATILRRTPDRLTGPTSSTVAGAKGLVRSPSEGGDSCRRARRCPSTSATSEADWNRLAGSLASSRSMIAASHAGMSGFTSRTGRWRVVADPPQHAQRGRCPERRTAGAHGVQHGAQAEQVGAVVDRLAPGLLGRHEQGRAGDDAALGQAGVVHRAGQAEVGDLHALDAVLQQDVRRLDVAMDQPLRVGRGQARCGLHADPQDRVQVERRRCGRSVAGARCPG